MECQGIVTDVNTTFLFFTIDNHAKIHMSILLTQKESQKMPKIGSKIRIKTTHRKEYTYSICGESELEGDFTEEYTQTFFYDLVKDHKLGFTDLLRVDKIVDTFYDCYANLSGELKTDLITKILEYIIIYLRTFYEDHVCLNNTLSSTHFRTVSMCKHIEIKPEINKYADFPYWSFGTHSKPKEGTLLFGHMEIQTSYGFLMLRDYKYQIPCVLYNNTVNNTLSIENSYVFIKEYKVITEIYKDGEVPNIEYFLIDFNDIILIHKEEIDEGLFGTLQPHHNFKNKVRLQVLKKSTVVIGNKGKPECWLHVLIQGSPMGEIFLILPSNYIQIVIYLQEGEYYKLYHNIDWKQTRNVELSRIKKLAIYELQENDALFEQLYPADREVYNTVKQCKEILLNNTDMTSFEGVLKVKKFTPPLPSRTTKRSNMYGFGTPGPKVHLLTFSMEDGGNEIHLDCYLNNWENMLMPLGLIPQMRLIVRNVYPQSRKYLKSCVFTTFEVVAYEPKTHFDTVNLYEHYDIDWGKRSFLGLGNKIPQGALLWGRVYNVQAFCLKINRICGHCKAQNRVEGPCTHCGRLEKSVECLTKMNVGDELGQLRLITKSQEVMKTIFNLTAAQSDFLTEAVMKLAYYEYNFFEEVMVVDSLEEHRLLRETVTEMLRQFNDDRHGTFDVKCRKMESDPQNNNGKPVWYCIEARKSIC